MPRVLIPNTMQKKIWVISGPLSHVCVIQQDIRLQPKGLLNDKSDLRCQSTSVFLFCQPSTIAFLKVSKTRVERIVKYNDLEQKYIQFEQPFLHDCLPVSVTGLSYGSHTVGFTPPATLSRAAISHYNTPALHVHGGSSHAVAVSNIRPHLLNQTSGKLWVFLGSRRCLFSIYTEFLFLLRFVVVVRSLQPRAQFSNKNLSCFNLNLKILVNNLQE